MFKQMLNVIRQNPVIPLIYAAVMLLSGALLLLMPERFDTSNPFRMIAMVLTMLLITIFLGAISLVFTSGFGNMLSVAVNGGRADYSTFFSGIKKYFVKVLLMSLLMIAFSIGISIIITMFSLPFTIIASMRRFAGHFPSISSSYSISAISGAITIFTYILTVVGIPFITLWLPALFMESGGVFECLKKGAKAGVKNYWLLFSFIALITAPSIIYTFVSYIPSISSILTMPFGKSQNPLTGLNYFTPGFVLMFAITCILSFFFSILIFVIYKNWRQVSTYHNQ